MTLRAIEAVFVCAAVLASGCSRTGAPDSPQRGGDADATARPAPSHESAPRSTTGSALGEFEPITEGDVDLYLKVMRTAADRLAHLSASDREALKSYRKMNRGGSAQPTGPADVFAMQRAIGLLQMDGIVANEMGVRERYNSIAARVQEFAGATAPGDAGAPISIEEQRRMRATDPKYQKRHADDAAVIQPHLSEIEALQKKVNLVAYPESLPQ